MIKGWDGLAWLSGYPWAAPVVCVFFALSALLPLSASIPLSPARKGAFVD
jgi:hypothetical protein